MPDQLWRYVESVLAELDPPKVEGRKRADQRAILNGIIFRVRSGCQWNNLPKQSDRAKAGTKRSILVEGGSRPLSVIVAGANVHDAKLLWETLEKVVIACPEPTPEAPQHLCLDRGYENPTGRDVVVAHDCVPHIHRTGETVLVAGVVRYPARRWVVERTLAWLSKCRGILVRYEKKARNYLHSTVLSTSYDSYTFYTCGSFVSGFGHCPAVNPDHPAVYSPISQDYAPTPPPQLPHDR